MAHTIALFFITCYTYEYNELLVICCSDIVYLFVSGFLYMSEFLHQWLTATQYIAPLMANFDTKIGNSSNIHYADNGKCVSQQHCLKAYARCL